MKSGLGQDYSEKEGGRDTGEELKESDKRLRLVKNDVYGFGVRAEEHMSDAIKLKDILSNCREAMERRSVDIDSVADDDVGLCSVNEDQGEEVRCHSCHSLTFSHPIFLSRMAIVRICHPATFLPL